MDLYLKLNYLIINVLGASNQIFSLTVILPKEQRISAIFEERFLESAGDYYYYFLLFNYKFEQSIPS